MEEVDVYVDEGVASPPSWEDWVVEQYGLGLVPDEMEWVGVVEEWGGSVGAER